MGHLTTYAASVTPEGLLALASLFFVARNQCPLVALCAIGFVVLFVSTIASVYLDHRFALPYADSHDGSALAPQIQWTLRFYILGIFGKVVAAIGLAGSAAYRMSPNNSLKRTGP
jgi:hypothetical protein